MTTTFKLGSTPFLTGSSIEGNAYTRHLAQQPMQDLDFMIVEGTIKSPDCILKLENVAGFVQVKYDERFIEQHSPTPFSTKSNQHGVLCINGFKMKEKYCGVDVSSFFPRSTVTSIGETTTASASAEIKYKSIFETTSLSEQFETILNLIRRMRVQEDVEQFQPKYVSACNTLRKSISQNILPMLQPIVDAEHLHQQMFQDIISLTFPMYHIQIPAVNQVRSNALLEFYEKYKYLGNASMLEDHIEYGLLSMNFDVDLVPALKLDFWPDDMQVFLNRIQNARPQLYEIIREQASMHVIPKWSSKTLDIDQELEFRYSFSAIERLLAKHRTRREQILNGVARSIYYRYLKKEPCIEDHTKTIVPSYFIKTTVLWMCELYNFNDLCSETDDDQTIAYIMAREWLDYVRSLLRSSCCPHYFIDSFNLLETCSSASLIRAESILEHEIHLNEDIKIDVLIKQDELMSKKQQTMENWLQNMKVKDILAAVNDYRLLRENWLCPSEENQDEGDVLDCLYILNQLRALDGDKQQNWSTFQRLFLTADQTNWLPPTWDEQVADCSVCDFVDGFIALGTTMKNILEIMEKSDFEQTLTRNSSETEFFRLQNLLNDLVQPSGIVQNGLMTSWIPMFTCSYFNGSSRSIPSIRQRSVITNHPTGPFQDLLQGRTCPTPLNSQSRQTYQQYAQSVSYQILDLLNDAPNVDMTLEDLLKYHDRPSQTTQPVMTSSIEEQILSHATNPSSVNKESITLIVFDPNHIINNTTDEEYRTINDYVLVYGAKSQLLTYVQSISEEFIFIILCQYSSDEEFLSQLNGVTFKLNSLDFDDKLGVWIAHLIFSHEGVQIAQNYIGVQQETMERMTLPLIMANLLFKMNGFSATKKYLDSLKNEDEALIYHFYGILHHGKGEYALALDNFQIAYELMISDGRIQDSALVLHDLGYVYDMKKEFNNALDSHKKALEITQTYCQANDFRIGISLYNIGRTLVNMDDHNQALIYHQNALAIFEHTLTYNHIHIAQSLHSHAVVYFNMRDYNQAFDYYTRALELYETIVPRDEHGILMVKNALETIQELLP
ncbi:unnamed protein product [Rotaria sp. Silwood1]|nr:unnamed protein product [Rotaria sp. Silwood1]